MPALTHHLADRQRRADNEAKRAQSEHTSENVAIARLELNKHFVTPACA